MLSIRVRLFLTYIVLILATIGLTGTVFVYTTYDSSRNRTEAALKARAAGLNRFINKFAHNPSDLQRVISMYADSGAQSEDIQWLALDTQGNVLADPWKMATRIPREQLMRREGGGDHFFTTGPATGQQDLHVTVALHLNGVPVAYADFFTSLKDVTGTIAHVERVVGQAAAVLMILAVLLSAWITGGILAPVTRVRDVAADMAAGNLRCRVPPMGGDELGQLGQTINTLADEIQRNIDGIIGGKRRQDAMLSSMVDGVVTVSSDGAITFVNQMAGRILTDAAREAVGPDAGEEAAVAEAYSSQGSDELPGLLGQKLADLLGAAPVAELMELSAASGTISRETALGEKAFVVFAIPLGEAGSNAETLFLLRDVTSLRQLETARSQFLGNVSHELKTPLTIIKGFVITLLKTPGMLDEWKRYLDFIDRESDRLARLVDDLLNLARLRSKRTQMNFTFCDAGELLREIYKQLQAQAVKYDSMLAFDCPFNLPVLLADPDRFKEIIINLVDNAFKYTPPKGRVELGAKATPEYLHVRVRDHGAGIPQEEIPFLFERFFRGTDKGGRKSGGTGIGLAIVKEIVDAHHGRITVESVAGEGTTFDVALPLRQKGRRVVPTADGSERQADRGASGSVQH